MVKQNELDLEISIGLSRKWDAREAGREVAKTAIKKLTRPPSFFLLYSTIHYKNHGGFEEFLKGVWDVLPDGTPLVGGTVACFINNQGCFSRGATALALSYRNIDVALGIGKNSKINPKRAARACAEMIKNKLKNSKYSNKFLINMISAGKLPDLPIFGRIHIIKSKISAAFATYIGMRIFPYLGYGFGKEEEVIDYLAGHIPDFYIIGASSVDSCDILDNYQFIDKRIVSNSIVALACTIDLPIFIQSEIGLHETDKTFEITKTSRDKRIIKKINNKPAKKELLDLLKITEDQFKEFGPFFYRVSNYLPFTFEENRKYTSGTGGFFGNNIYLGYKVRGKNARILSITGNEILNTIDKFFNNNEKQNYPFIFMSSSAILLNTLGSKAHEVKRKLDFYLKDTPYLMMCSINENIGSPDEHPKARVYSFNVMSMKNNYWDCV